MVSHGSFRIIHHHRSLRHVRAGQTDASASPLPAQRTTGSDSAVLAKAILADLAATRRCLAKWAGTGT
eukprot:352658-Alexandrium_andersonii.AAC.1